MKSVLTKIFFICLISLQSGLGQNSEEKLKLLIEYNSFNGGAGKYAILKYDIIPYDSDGNVATWYYDNKDIYDLNQKKIPIKLKKDTEVEVIRIKEGVLNGIYNQWAYINGIYMSEKIYNMPPDGTTDNLSVVVPLSKLKLTPYNFYLVKESIFPFQKGDTLMTDEVKFENYKQYLSPKYIIKNNLRFLITHPFNKPPMILLENLTILNFSEKLIRFYESPNSKPVGDFSIQYKMDPASKLRYEYNLFVRTKMSSSLVVLPIILTLVTLLLLIFKNILNFNNTN